MISLSRGKLTRYVPQLQKGMCVICHVLCVYSSFKLFLELEPQLREIVYKLHDSKYAHSLKLLDEMKVCMALLSGVFLLLEAYLCCH